jgi:CheY-like chemotaxis protein
MDPPRPFAGSEKVVAALADAISKAGPLQILVAEESDDAFKEIKGSIEEHGWGVNRATSGRDALAKAGAFPPVDLVIISTKLKADLPAKAGEEGQEDVLNGLARNRMTSLIPVAMLIDKAELVAEQARFGNRPMIARGTKGRPLAEDIISALGTTGPGVTKQKREALAARAAGALLEIDPRLTQMLTADCAEACHNAVKSSPRRPDDVRNPCLRALGLFKVTAATADVAAVFGVKENSVEIRRNSLYALGEIAAVEHKATFLKAQHDETDFSLRNEAAVAYGKSQLTPEPEKVTEFVKENRLPRTNEGGDGRSDALKGTAAPAGDAAPAPAAPAAAPATPTPEADN